MSQICAQKPKNNDNNGEKKVVVLQLAALDGQGRMSPNNRNVALREENVARADPSVTLSVLPTDGARVGVSLSPASWFFRCREEEGHAPEWWTAHCSVMTSASHSNDLISQSQ